MVRLSGSSEEWGLVELQGVLETHEGHSFDGLYIGDLHFTAAGTPNLIVGHHLLTGKVISLPKPLAVMRTGPDRKEYDVIAIISKKIIFRNRPKPLVGSKK